MDESSDARLADRQRRLLERFQGWLTESPQRDDLALLAGGLLDLFARETLDDLLDDAPPALPPDEVPAWVRSRFDAAIGDFGMAIRASIPDSRRHAAAQVLQLRMLQAERMLADGLDRWSRGD